MKNKFDEVKIGIMDIRENKSFRNPYSFLMFPAKKPQKSNSE